jgi:hypothetical protein
VASGVCRGLNGRILRVDGHGLLLRDRVGKQCGALAGDAAIEEEGSESGEAAIDVDAEVEIGG